VSTGVSAGGQAVPEYFAKSVEFSVHQREVWRWQLRSRHLPPTVEKQVRVERSRGDTNAWRSYAKMCCREQNSFLQMSAIFDLNHDRLAGDSKFATIARSLSAQSRIDSRDAFNRYCRKACLLWSEHFCDRRAAVQVQGRSRLSHVCGFLRSML
jgi:hypothetical protein